MRKVYHFARRSPLSGKMNTLDICLDMDDYLKWVGGQGLIQDLMPYLTADERAFLMTGITKEEWDEMFKEEPNDSIGNED